MKHAGKPLAIDRVWRRLGVLVRVISPIAIASRFFLPRAQRGRYLSWLRPLEAIARRLLFLEALALPQSAITPQAHAARKAQTQPPRSECVFASHGWRAPFRILPRPKRPRVRRRIVTIKLPDDGYACSRVPPRPVSAMGVARRIEALRRVIADPAPHARRLARQLARLNAHTKVQTIDERFAPLRRGASFGKSGLLLTVVQSRADCARAQFRAAHALAGWDNSS